MLNIMPDRLVAPGLLNRSLADLRFETAPIPQLSERKHNQSPARVSNYSQPGIDTAAFLAELALSAPCRVHPIPIHPPR